MGGGEGREVGGGGGAEGSVVAGLGLCTKARVYSRFRGPLSKLCCADSVIGWWTDWIPMDNEH